MSEVRTREDWSAAEWEILYAHFTSNVSVETTCQRIHKVNPTRKFSSIDRTIRAIRKEGGFLKPKEILAKSMRVGLMDIETSDLDPAFGICLCWYIKELHTDHFDSALITRKELQNPNLEDKRVITDLLKTMATYDRLVLHYGTDRRFDIPYVRSRGLILGLDDLLAEFHIHRTEYCDDTWKIAKNKLHFKSNRLDYIAKTLSLDVQKTPIEPKEWRRALTFSDDALQYIDEHCKADVIVLERVWDRFQCIHRPTWVRV